LVVPESQQSNSEEQINFGPSVRQFFHSDPVGSTAMLTNQSGERTQELDYFPFGEELFDKRAPNDKNLPQEYRFDGKEIDSETGLQYFGARYYDPHIGRWISADPLYRTTPDVGLDEPRDLNLYAFALDNPVRNHDLNGLQTIWTINIGGRTIVFDKQGNPIRSNLTPEEARHNRAILKGIVHGIAQAAFGWLIAIPEPKDPVTREVSEVTRGPAALAFALRAAAATAPIGPAEIARVAEPETALAPTQGAPAAEVGVAKAVSQSPAAKAISLSSEELAEITGGARYPLIERLDRLFYEAARPYLSEGAWNQISTLARINRTSLAEEAAPYFSRGTQKRIGSDWYRLAREKDPEGAAFLRSAAQP
jgi:RHS repeat-associated protein